MAEITAAMVKELRELTGLGMMECKKALEEAGGDIKKAEELLRITRGAKASKAASRGASEGTIGAAVSADGKVAAMVEVNCETDFVARNPDFASFAAALAGLVAKDDPKDVAALAQLKIGENITVRRFERIRSDAMLTQYIHPPVGKVGVTVDYEGQESVGRDVAMHIAFAKPQFLSRGEVDPGVIARERAILEARVSARSSRRARRSPASRPRSSPRWSKAASTSSSPRSRSSGRRS
ncbi:MAG: translation elongation factor Ts [Usitatibacter sp.]